MDNSPDSVTVAVRDVTDNTALLHSCHSLWKTTKTWKYPAFNSSRKLDFDQLERLWLRAFLGRQKNIRFWLTRHGGDHLVDEAREVKSKLHHSRHVLVAFTLKVTPVSKTRKSKVIVIEKRRLFFCEKKTQSFPPDIQTKTGLVNETLSPVFGKASEIAYNSSRYRSLCKGLVVWPRLNLLDLMFGHQMKHS